MKHQQLLARLLPPRTYEISGTGLSAELKAEGEALDRAQQKSGQVLNSVTPIGAIDTLPDWERVCGLTPADGSNRQQRLEAVLAKLQELGGLSIPYFKGLARRLGYEIEITEFEPFFLDYSHLNEDILFDQDVIWVWQVSVIGGQVRAFPFYLDMSSVDEALLSFSDSVIEEYFRDLKPAHTFVLFDYQE
ncbi:DUF2313 domain-containing protein [Achromobacter seleniivolatilans]|uniref:DUF2313 domain-containing protein n=1 Tax=Achromobacter seleniivolatilans TaxID=3047478 RepID=A0ABY9M7W3_9BURK|nr:putative phage tail protein [Achromobacter sp. R39]WMD23109.1 DUF2313 domain-containing protein [Achromobacter sp. R39]